MYVAYTKDTYRWGDPLIWLENRARRVKQNISVCTLLVGSSRKLRRIAKKDGECFNQSGFTYIVWTPVLQVSRACV